MPSTALQSRISAFEAITNPSLSPSFPSSSVSRKTQNNGRLLNEATRSPPLTPRQPEPASPSPSPPNLGRKTSLIDLKDWVVDDGVSPPPTNGFKYFGAPDNTRTPTQQGFASHKKSIPPLINLESPPKLKTKLSPILPTKAAPPLPPRKPSYASLKSLPSSSSLDSHSVSSSPHPANRVDSLTVDHTYPPPKIDIDPRSRNISGHAPASSVSSFHSVSLSSDTDPSTPGSISSNFISTFPMDHELEQKSEEDAVSLDESYEEVSTPSIASPATERIIFLDWERAMAKQKPVPPRLPQRPSSSSSYVVTGQKSPPPNRQSSPSSSSTPSSPGFRASVSSFSSSSSTTNGPPGRRAPPPPPSRSSDRSSILSATTTHSINSNHSHSSHSHDAHGSRPLSNIHLKTKRPTPVPAAARARYESVFNANVVQCRKVEKQKAKEKPAFLSPTEARGTRRAAGWRGLSVDLITGDHDTDTLSVKNEEVSTSVDSAETLDGHTIKVIWRRTRLSRRKLAAIWNESDPEGTGSLNRDQFVKGMWRLDEELRRGQMHALRSASSAGLSSFRDGSVFKPLITKNKPIFK